MGKKEKFYIICVIALLSGAYFFIHSLMFPKPKSFAVYGEPKIRKIQRQRNNSELLDARTRREQMKSKREFEKIRPYLKIQTDYLEGVNKQIEKLPSYKRTDQKEIMKVITKEREKYMYLQPGASQLKGRKEEIKIFMERQNKMMYEESARQRTSLPK